MYDDVTRRCINNNNQLCSSRNRINKKSKKSKKICIELQFLSGVRLVFKFKYVLQKFNDTILQHKLTYMYSLWVTTTYIVLLRDGVHKNWNRPDLNPADFLGWELCHKNGIVERFEALIIWIAFCYTSWYKIGAGCKNGALRKWMTTVIIT